LEKDVPQALDILSDVLQNSAFDKDHIEREKSTILREAQEVDGQLEEVIFDRLHETAYRGTSLGRTILGTTEHINNMTQDQIRNYVQTHYTAPRMVLSGAGAISHEQLVELGSKYFGKVPSRGPTPVHMEPARFTGSNIIVRDDAMSHLHIAYGFPTAGWLDADNFPLMIIQTLLGNWTQTCTGGRHSSSHLIRTIAEEGFATSVTAFNTQYSDTGLFGVYAVTDDVFRTSDLTAHIQLTMTRLCYEVDDALIAEAKLRLLSTLLAQYDGSTPLCEDIGRQILTYGRHLDIVEVQDRIEAVTPDSVRACANRFFYDRDFALAAIGPTHELPDYNWMRGKTFLSRL